MENKVNLKCMIAYINLFLGTGALLAGFPCVVDGLIQAHLNNYMNDTLLLTPNLETL